MNPEKIESFIDKKILQKFSDENLNIEAVIEYINENIVRFSSRETYIPISRNYLVRNWDLINFKKRYNTYYVIHSKKRVEDLLWCKSKVGKSIKENQIFNLLLFKEKMLKTKQIIQS